MISKAERIAKKNDFDLIFKKGLKIKEGLILLRVLPNKLNFSRFAVIVSLKVSKKAVLRNKIRRKIFNLLRQNADKVVKGLDIVFIVLPGFKEEYLDKIGQTMENIFKKIKNV